MALELFTSKDLPTAVRQEIVAFLDSQDTGHPLQFPQWAGVSTSFAVLRQAGQICWFASCGTHFPLGRRFQAFRALMINRGPVCDDRTRWQSGLEELVQHAQEAGFVFLKAAPDWLHRQENDATLDFGQEWEQDGGERASLRLDLTKSNEELLAGLRKNTRYEVRRAERVNVKVEPATQDADLEEFLQLYAGMAERKGFSADPPEHVRGIVCWLMTEPTRGALLLARDQASIAGGAVIVRSGRRCWYVWGASEKHDQFSAGHALQWRAIQWAKARGCTEYDFGGYTPGATSGPAWFKEGFGGEVVHFVPAQRRVIRRGHYVFVNTLSRLR